MADKHAISRMAHRLAMCMDKAIAGDIPLPDGIEGDLQRLLVPLEAAVYRMGVPNDLFEEAQNSLLWRRVAAVFNALETDGLLEQVVRDMFPGLFATDRRGKASYDAVADIRTAGPWKLRNSSPIEWVDCVSLAVGESGAGWRLACAAYNRAVADGLLANGDPVDLRTWYPAAFIASWYATVRWLKRVRRLPEYHKMTERVRQRRTQVPIIAACVAACACVQAPLSLGLISLAVAAVDRRHAPPVRADRLTPAMKSPLLYLQEGQPSDMHVIKLRAESVWMLRLADVILQINDACVEAARGGHAVDIGTLAGILGDTPAENPPLHLWRSLPILAPATKLRLIAPSIRIALRVVDRRQMAQWALVYGTHVRRFLLTSVQLDNDLINRHCAVIVQPGKHMAPGLFDRGWVEFASTASPVSLHLPSDLFEHAERIRPLLNALVQEDSRAFAMRAAQQQQQQTNGATTTA